MHEEHHVGVLFDGTGLSQVGQFRSFVGALFRITVQLGEHDHGALQFLGEHFALAGEVRHFLLTVLDGFTGGHELQVVDDDKLQPVDLAAESTGISHGWCSC